MNGEAGPSRDRLPCPRPRSDAIVPPAASVQQKAARWAWRDSAAAQAGRRWLPRRESERIERWAEGVIDRGLAVGRLPKYGTHDWFELDATDPRRLAALVVAGECWRRDGTPAAIARRQHVELAHARHLEQIEADRMHAQVAPRVRALAFVPLAVSREDEIAAANEPRPGDHLGGSVRWSGGAA